MYLHRSLVPPLLAVVVVVVSLLVVLAPTAAHDVGRYLQPFAGFAGTERLMVLVIAVGLLVLAASTFLTARTAVWAARQRR